MYKVYEVFENMNFPHAFAYSIQSLYNFKIVQFLSKKITLKDRSPTEE